MQIFVESACSRYGNESCERADVQFFRPPSFLSKPCENKRVLLEDQQKVSKWI